MGHIVGRDFPYEIEDNAAAEKEEDANQGEEMDQDDEPVEGLRDGKKSADLSHNDEDDGFPPPNDGDDDQHQHHQQEQDEDDFAAPVDDEEEEQNLLTQPNDEPTVTAESIEEGSVFSLGLVNDVLGDSMVDEDDPRQLAGDELVSSNSKWHAHTIKVYNMLKTAMAAPGDADAAGEGGMAKPSKLSFEGLSKNCSRRTAAGVFFELLQLKTWDYIDVDQNESFGNIIITPGPKFGESAPSD
jgi:cohesin complex subunit SCC1